MNFEVNRWANLFNRGHRNTITIPGFQMEQIYTRRPIPAIAKAIKPTKAQRIAELLTGDVLVSEIVQRGEPVNVNQEQAAKRSGCSTDTVKRALQDLVKRQILTVHKEYSAGNFARSYTLTEAARDSPVIWRTYRVNRLAQIDNPAHIQNEDTAAQLEAFNRITVDWRTAAQLFIERKVSAGACTMIDQRKAWGNFHRCKSPAQIAQALDQILTIEDTREGKYTRLEFEFRMYQLDELARGAADYYAFEHSKTGRIYSTFTQIPREFRKCLRVHHSGAWNANSQPAEIAPYYGKRMHEVDVKASQIALLSALLDRGGINASKLKEDTAKGKFHGRMMGEMNIPAEAKDTKYKPALFHWLYGFEYKEGHQPKRKGSDQLKRWNEGQQTRAAFAGAFGQMYGAAALQYIQDHKRRKGYKALPIELQKMEAAAIIKRAARRIRHLYPQAPVITCHDSIIVPEDEAILAATDAAIKHAYKTLYCLEVSTNYEAPEPIEEPAEQYPPTDWEAVQLLIDYQRTPRQSDPHSISARDLLPEIMQRLNLGQSLSDESRRTPPHEY